MVPPYSDQVSRVWPYSGFCAASVVFTYATLTLFGVLSHTLRLTTRVLKAVRTPEVFLLPGYGLLLGLNLLTERHGKAGQRV